MVTRYFALAAALVLGFGESRLAAQVELSAGYGAHVSRLATSGRDNPLRTFFGLGGSETATTFSTSVTAAYRPSARLAFRATTVISSRRVESPFSSSTFNGRPSQLISGTVDLGAEVAYYPKPWYSVGVGGGYSVSKPRSNSRGLAGSPLPLSGLARAIAPQSFCFTHLALEGYAGIFTLRAAPYLSVSRVFSDELSGLIINGRPQDLPRGHWVGLNASVLVRVPFGKTRYGSEISFDSLLDRSLVRVASAMPLWGFGATGRLEGTIAAPGADPDDAYTARPLKARYGLQSTYYLHADWRLRGSIAMDFISYASSLDSVQRISAPQQRTVYSGVDLMIGAERRLWRQVFVAAEVGPMKTFNSWTRNIDPDHPNGTTVSPPRANVIWLGAAEVFGQVGPRWRLGAVASYTLNDTHGTEPDQRLSPNVPRDGRWVSIGASAGWMLLRS